MSTPSVVPIERVLDELRESGRPYREFLRVPAMSCGIYVLAPGEIDRQKPHAEDEIYYVIQGAARIMIRTGDDGAPEVIDREVAPGDVIFVRARDEHRFYGIVEELHLLVIFAPAESE